MNCKYGWDESLCRDDCQRKETEVGSQLRHLALTTEKRILVTQKDQEYFKTKKSPKTWQHIDYRA